MKWNVLKCAVIGLLASIGVSCGGNSNTGQSTGGARGNGTDTMGANGADGSQIAFVVPATTCPKVSSASAAGLMILVPYDRPVSYTCPSAGTCVSYEDLTSIALAVANYSLNGAATPVTSGTYALTTAISTAEGNLAIAQIRKTDASCAPINPTGGFATGSITIDSVSGSAVTGSYDVTLDGTRYSGNIDAVVCPSDPIHGDVCSGDVHVTACTGGSQQCL